MGISIQVQASRTLTWLDVCKILSKKEIYCEEDKENYKLRSLRRKQLRGRTKFGDKKKQEEKD